MPAVEYKLQQVFLNLFLNARDAMPKGGWLSIATRVEGGQAVVEVADTGAGIPTEHLARIYDPFFTTKPIGQGTGLGLSITYGIVREHDGIDQLRQRGGPGHAVHAALPAGADAAAVRRDEPRRGRHQRTGTVGYDTTRHRSSSSTTKKSCARSSRRCSSARATACGWPSTGTEGLELARSMPFDAAIVDVMMPGIDGLQMLEELKKHRRGPAGPDDHGLRVDRDARSRR